MKNNVFLKIKKIWSNLVLTVISMSSCFMTYGTLTAQYNFLYEDQIESIVGTASAFCFYLTIFSITYIGFWKKVRILQIIDKVILFRRTFTKSSTFQSSFTSRVFFHLIVKFLLNGVVIIFLPFFIAKSINDTSF